MTAAVVNSVEKIHCPFMFQNVRRRVFRRTAGTCVAPNANMLSKVSNDCTHGTRGVPCVAGKGEGEEILPKLMVAVAGIVARRIKLVKKLSGVSMAESGTVPVARYILFATLLFTFFAARAKTGTPCQTKPERRELITRSCEIRPVRKAEWRTDAQRERQCSNRPVCLCKTRTISRGANQVA